MDDAQDRFAKDYEAKKMYSGIFNFNKKATLSANTQFRHEYYLRNRVWSTPVR